MYSEDLRDLVESNSFLTTRELAKTLGVSHIIVENQLHKMGKVNKSGAWVPHQLTEDNMATRYNICTSLLTRNNIESFLNRIITGDEKWILYDNVKKKRQWVDRGEEPEPTAKAGLHPKKVLLCIWWDISGPVHYELMPTNRTVNSEIYAAQMDRLHEKLKCLRPALVNRKQVILLHDNAKPHTAKIVKDKLIDLNWEVLPHPPNSPDIASLDYYLFRSLQNYLNDKTFEDEADLEKGLSEYFSSHSSALFHKGIYELPERWRQVVESDGGYFVD